MNKFNLSEQQKAKFVSIFSESFGLDILQNRLQSFFEEVFQNYPYLKLPQMDIVSTASLKYQVYYQEPDADPETLTIGIGHWNIYIWRTLDGNWCLDDLYEEPIGIVAEILTLCPLFLMIPKNVKNLKELLEIGMILEKHLFQLPKFSEIQPDDCREVLSWDGRYLLTGNKVENLKLYSYREWDELIQRENFFNNELTLK